jgi:hypothetical protein
MAENKETSVRDTSFNSAFPGAQEIRLPTNEVLTFHKLDIDDLGAWCTSMHEQWKKKQNALIPNTVRNLELFNSRRIIEFATPTLDDIADAVFRPDGIKEALTRSIKKDSRISSDVADSLIKLIPPKTAAKLAKWCVGLFDDRIPTTPPAGAINKPPNDQESPQSGLVGSPDGFNKVGSVPPLESSLERKATSQNTGG